MTECESNLMPGGWTDEKDVEPHEQNLVDQVKSQLETKTGKTYETFEAVKFKTQVVNGTNYLVKVKVGTGDNDYVHVKLYLPLGENAAPQLTGYAVDKTAADCLSYDDLTTVKAD